jgi:hypothetical protein
MRLSRHQVAIAIIIAALLVLILIWARAPVSAPSQQSIATDERPKKAGPPWAYPEPTRTPGFPNPEITQANIGETICNPEWSTRSIRPPSSYTAKLKRQQIRELGLPGTPADYEEDHFISLELGGSPTDPRNLWPEPYDPGAGAKEKDVVENYLHKQVCTAAMTLEEAQKAIVTDWYSVYLQIR